MDHLYRALFIKHSVRSNQSTPNRQAFLAKLSVAVYPLILFVMAGALVYWLVNTNPQASIESPFVVNTHSLLLLGTACLIVLRQWVKKS